MILKQTEPMQPPTDVEFKDILMWVQYHNVSLNCMEPSIIKRVGEKVGRVIDVDVSEEGLCIGKFALVRVTRQIDKSLFRCVPLMHDLSDKEVLILLQYERLPEFCYDCGRVGHISKDCWDTKVEKGCNMFDNWLRAGQSYEGRGKKPVASGPKIPQHKHNPRIEVTTIVVMKQVNPIAREASEVDESGQELVEQGRQDNPIETSPENIELVGEVMNGTEQGEKTPITPSSSPITINVTSLLSKTKLSNTKLKGKRRDWKRLARESVGNKEDMDMVCVKAGSKRAGEGSIDANLWAPNLKQRKLMDEEKVGDVEKLEKMAAAALQPLRTL